jgi:threonine synthase
MGEGATPLISAGDGALEGVSFKLEFLSPTGSFKDRGAVVLMASAVERGASELVADSSGNAGSAVAAYAARAGLPITVFVPAGTSAAKQAQIRAYGAALELVPGDRTATAERAAAAVRERGALYASHVYDPYFLQGTKTYAYEVWEQLGGAPDTLILPAGNGTLLLGAAIGFAELAASGLITRPPALIAVQSEGCAPLARAWQTGRDEPMAVRAQPTAAEGIAIPAPARGSEMLAAVQSSQGCFLSVPEEAILPAQADLAARGLLVEPTGAIAWAAFLLARAPETLRIGGRAPTLSGHGWARAAELLQGSVVVPLTGSGLKTGAAVVHD